MKAKTYVLKVLLTQAQLRKGYKDYSYRKNIDSLDTMRARCYDEYFRNPALRAKYYSVEVYQADGKTRVGTMFISRDRDKKLVYVWSNDVSKYRNGFPYTYIADKKTGQLIGGF